MSKKKYIMPELVAYRDRIARKQSEQDLARNQHKKESLTKLELNTTYIDNIMQKYILPRNKEVTYEVYKAKSTNSIYLKLMYRRADCWIRFSDHDTKHSIETVSNREQDVDPADVINTIQNRINKLSYKSKMMAFESIEKEQVL